jgi:hypothetical protein
MRVIVLGYIVRGPLGGLTWHHLQYVMGLRDLGHDVYFMEDSDDYEACYDPVEYTATADPTLGLEFTRKAFDRVGLSERWAYHDAHTGSWRGPCAGNALDVCATADVLLNISGMNPMRDWFLQPPVRALIDTDPAFTQIRHLTDPNAMDTARQHNVFFSFGENIDAADCSIPSDGFPWQATRQPVVLNAWTTSPGPEDGRFSTVMQWESYQAREYAGRSYGMKSAAFQPFIDLPRRVGASLELALGSRSAPRDLLRERGWLLTDPYEATSDPWVYQEFIRQSKAEFTVAKHGYAATRSGWFSERSAAYLASGRPVVTQNTGFRSLIPVGDGLFDFDSPDQAKDGIDSVNARYQHHCRAARELTEEYFAAGKVLTALLDAIDYAKRTVTLKGPQGNTRTIEVDPSVKRFKE